MKYVLIILLFAFLIPLYNTNASVGFGPTCLIRANILDVERSEEFDQPYYSVFYIYKLEVIESMGGFDPLGDSSAISREFTKICKDMYSPGEILDNVDYSNYIHVGDLLVPAGSSYSERALISAHQEMEAWEKDIKNVSVGSQVELRLSYNPDPKNEGYSASGMSISKPTSFLSLVKEYVFSRFGLVIFVAVVFIVTVSVFYGKNKRSRTKII